MNIRFNLVWTLLASAAILLAVGIGVYGYYADRLTNVNHAVLPTNNSILPYTPVDPSTIINHPVLGIDVVSNQINVTYKSTVTFSEVQQLIESLGGRVIGHLPSVQSLQVEVVDYQSFSDTEKLIDALRNDERILTATLSTVLSPF